MGVSFSVYAGIAAVLVALAVAIFFIPKGKKAAAVERAVERVVGPIAPAPLDPKQHALNKLAADDALQRDARADIETEIMRKRAAHFAQQEAILNARLTAGIAASLGVPEPTPAPAPSAPAPGGAIPKRLRPAPAGADPILGPGVQSEAPNVLISRKPPRWK